MTVSLAGIAKDLALHLGLFALVLVALSEIRSWPKRFGARLQGPYLGLALGLTASLGMSMPIGIASGTFLDLRGVLVGLAGAFGGPWGGAVAALLPGLYRAALGGPGAAAGTLAIALYGLAGVAIAAVAARQRRSVQLRDLPPLVVLQVSATLGSFLLLGPEARLALFPTAAPLLCAMMVVATPLLGLLLIRAEDRRNLLKQLAASENRLQAIASNIPGMVYQRVLEPDGSSHYSYLSSGVEAIFGIAPAEGLRTPDGLLAAVHPADRGRILADLARSARELSVCESDYRVTDRAGHTRWMRAVSRPRRTPAGATVWEGVTIDVTDEQKAKQALLDANAALAREVERRQRAEAEKVQLIAQLAALSETDALTGVANRRGFDRVAQREFKRARRSGAPLSLLALDVDHFKRVNDVHGHPVGDLVLRSVAGACRNVLRETDCLARFGGEEFVLLLHDADAERALIIASRLRAAISATPTQTEVGPVRVTASIGVATLLASTDRLEALLEEADRALYEAKDGGRDRVVLAAASRIRAVPPIPAPEAVVPPAAAAA